MQNALGLPANIVIDQEGGIVSRLVENFTVFPGNMALAATQDPFLARQTGLALGQEMKAVGIPHTLAPVVDSVTKTSFIGTRSFGEDPDQVIAFAKAMIDGFHEAGVSVTLKHAPGLRRGINDSHTNQIFVEISEKEMQEVELKPFTTLHELVETLMTAHVSIPQIDPHHCATRSSKLLSLIREQMKDVVMISDSLVMIGCTPNQNSWEETVAGVTHAAIESFNAGADYLILGRLEWAKFEGATTPETNQKLNFQVLERFCEAVKEGMISEQKLHTSLRRILDLKFKHFNRKEIPNISVIKCAKHVELADTIAKKLSLYFLP
ncbi:MAG: glycoside hydrolase family 3 protein [Parachlamydiaceae bacterium]|nr:MAG: glycoside hydrolase family 3 protein [Parachlamydiaceae bacterium]